MEYTQITHTLTPIFDAHSKILMLGTMPSPKSRELGFYYAHTQNRYWPVLSSILGEQTPHSIQERTAFLLRNRIALWDVLHSCEIVGADDSSIKNPVANDLRVLLDKANILAIFTTGTRAAALYKKHCLPFTKREAIALPSTSPANCRHYTFEKLIDAYRIILPYLNA